MHITWLSSATVNTAASENETWESFLVKMGITKEIPLDDPYPEPRVLSEDEDDEYSDDEAPEPALGYALRVGQRVPLTTQAHKTRLAAFSPARFEDLGGGTLKGRLRRRGENVSSINLVCFDYDDLDQDTLAEVMDAVRDYKHAFYTSYSHGVSPVIKARLVLPIESPVAAADWSTVWPGLLSWIPGEPDEKCGDLVRMFFCPATVESRIDQSFMWSHDGETLDVDTIPMVEIEARPEDFAPSSLRSVATEELTALQKNVRIDLKGPLQALEAGKAYATKGDRHGVMLRLTHYLTFQFPDASPDSLTDMFKKSLYTMAGAEGDFDPVEALESVRKAIDSSFQKRLVQKAQKHNEEQTERRRIIDRVTGGARDTQYSQAELKAFADSVGAKNLDEFRKQIILRDGAGIHVFINGQYARTPCRTTQAGSLGNLIEELMPFPDDFAPATSTNPKTGLVKNLTMDQLFEKYATHATTSAGTLLEGGVRFNRPKRELEIGFGGLVEVGPEFSSVVDTWLRLLAGDSYPELEIWLKHCTDLSQPLTALYIEGRKGSGKTFLAHCVAQLWGKEPLDARLTDNRFLLLSEGPLVLADEDLPPHWINKSGSARIRSFISAPSRTLDRKHLNPLTVRGYMRLMFTANNSTLLDFDENLSTADREAILERVIYIKAPEASSDFLRSLDFPVMDIKTKGVFSRHVAWMRENVSANRYGRFGVKQATSGLSDHLDLVGKTTSGILAWLTEYLRDPKKLDRVQGSASSYIQVRDGVLLVSPSCMSDRQDWALYTGSVRGCPSIAELGPALQDLSAQETVGINGVDFFQVDLRRVTLYAERGRVLNKAQIQESLRAIERSRKKATPVLCD